MKILFIDSHETACYQNHEMQYHVNLANNLSYVPNNTVHIISILNKFNTAEQCGSNICCINLNNSSTLEYDVVFLCNIEKDFIYLPNIKNVRKVVLMVTSLVQLNMPLLQKSQSSLILCYSSVTLLNKMMSLFYLNDFNNVVFPMSVPQPLRHSLALILKENVIGLLGTNEEIDKELLQNQIDCSTCHVVCETTSLSIYEKMLYLIVMVDECTQFNYQILDAMRCGVNVILPNHPTFIEWFGTLPIYYDVIDTVDKQGHIINPYSVMLRIKHILAEILTSPVPAMDQEKLAQRFPPNGEIATNYLVQQLK